MLSSERTYRGTNMEKKNMSPESREKHLKQFYSSFIRYIMLSAAYILIWMLTGGGYFWPIWPVIVEGLFIGKYAHDLGLLTDVSKYKKDIMSAEAKWIENRVKKDLSEAEEMVENMMNKKSEKPYTATKNTGKPMSKQSDSKQTGSKKSVNSKKK